jgi:hypothetical protein
MKNYLQVLVFGLFACCIAACGGDRFCKNVDCGHGTCEDGLCACETGWTIGSDNLCSERIPCADVDCGHGTCNLVDELCDCDYYYEKDSTGKCTVAWRDKFLGSWQGTHISDAGDTVGPYTMVITPSTSEIQTVQIGNFCNWQCLGSGAIVNAEAGTSTLSFFQNFCPSISAISGTVVPPDPQHLYFNVTIYSSNPAVQIAGLFAKI